MLIRNRILPKTSVGATHFMERPDSVADVKFRYIRSHLMDNATNVVALVNWLPPRHTGNLPVFGVGTADYDFDDHLIWPWFGHGRVDDLDHRS